MITVENAKEVIDFLEETLSNSLFKDDAREKGYQCAITDIKEHYIDSVMNELN